MDSVLRALAIYGVLLVLFRVMGKRSLGQITTFDFVLLLIISAAVRNGLVGTDYSLTAAVVLVATLIPVDIGLSLLKQRSERVERWLEGIPLVIVENGRPLKERMDKARVDEAEVLTAARHLHGLERMEQIKYAVLERSGGISIMPRERPAAVPERGAA